MTITREHLELAALAAGHKIYGWCVLCDDRIAYADIGPEESVAWRPHLDGGDAAQLAARLNIQVVMTPVAALAGRPDEWRKYHAWHDGTEPDKMRAWRGAVVLCAAAVGERMRKGGA